MTNIIKSWQHVLFAYQIIRRYSGPAFWFKVGLFTVILSSAWFICPIVSLNSQKFFIHRISQYTTAPDPKQFGWGSSKSADRCTTDPLRTVKSRGIQRSSRSMYRKLLTTELHSKFAVVNMLCCLLECYFSQFNASDRTTILWSRLECWHRCDFAEPGLPPTTDKLSIYLRKIGERVYSFVFWVQPKSNPCFL